MGSEEMPKFNKTELYEYEESLKVFRDMYSVIQTATNKGRAEGMAEGERRKQLEISRTLKERGMSVNDIFNITELPIEEISKL